MVIVFSPVLIAQAMLLQQLQQVNAALAAPVSGRTQRARAANQSIIVGNTGAVSTDVQNANPVNL